MRLKDFIRRALFENYSIKIEGEEKAYLLSKDGALNKFGWMHITEIDYTVIFVNKGGDYGELQDHESQVIPHLLIKDVKSDMYGGINGENKNCNLYIEWNFQDRYEGEVFWNKNELWLNKACEYEVIGNIYENPELLEGRGK